jgi:hypothetical protein
MILVGVMMLPIVLKTPVGVVSFPSLPGGVITPVIKVAECVPFIGTPSEPSKSKQLSMGLPSIQLAPLH